MPKRHWLLGCLRVPGSPTARPPFWRPKLLKKPQSELGKNTRILGILNLRFIWFGGILKIKWSAKILDSFDFQKDLRCFLNPKSTCWSSIRISLEKKGHSFSTGQVNQPKISWKTAGLVGRWPWCFRHLYGCMWQEDVNLLCFVGWNGMGIMGLKLWLFRTLIFSNDIIPTKARGHQLFLVQIYDSCHLSQIYHPLLNKNQQKMQENMMIPFVEY